jgi:hypothetical protein
LRNSYKRKARALGQYLGFFLLNTLLLLAAAVVAVTVAGVGLVVC